jgi:hypothetical protein
MKIWTSSEAMADLVESLRSARRDVEQALNLSVASEGYGAGVSTWAIIYIVMDEDDPAYTEIRRYNKRAGVMEFRLKVDHRAFKEADPLAQRKLLAATVLRSLDLFDDVRVADFDADRFKRDLTQALRKNQWA